MLENPALALRTLWEPWLRPFVSRHGSKPTLGSYQPSVRVEHATEAYALRTARNGADLEKLLKLRYRVFHAEYGTPTSASQLDFDSHDMSYDHIAVFDRYTGQALGTYRITSSDRTRVFYSEEEFHLRPVLDLPGIKLELGRACIDPAFRTGPVLKLLWKGLLLYRQAVGARHFFGCSSVKTEDPARVRSLCGYLATRGKLKMVTGVDPKPRYRMPGLQWCDLRLQNGEAERSEDLIPPLLNSYLRAGAEVWGEPAWDRDFHCIDMLTVLDFERLPKAYARLET